MLEDKLGLVGRRLPETRQTLYQQIASISQFAAAIGPFPLVSVNVGNPGTVLVGANPSIPFTPGDLVVIRTASPNQSSDYFSWVGFLIGRGVYTVQSGGTTSFTIAGFNCKATVNGSQGEAVYRTYSANLGIELVDALLQLILTIQPLSGTDFLGMSVEDVIRARDYLSRAQSHHNAVAAEQSRGI